MHFVFQTSDIYSGEWARVWTGAIQSLPGRISSHTSSQTHYSMYTWNPLLSRRTASLRPCVTVDEWLRLLSRPTCFPEKCSGRPGEPPGLWGGALVSLEDRQGSNDEPEEEVDPHRRLKGGAEVRERRKTSTSMSIKSKESVYLGFEQTAVEPFSFKWTGPGLSLCLLAAFTKRETGFKSLICFLFCFLDWCT